MRLHAPPFYNIHSRLETTVKAANGCVVCVCVWGGGGQFSEVQNGRLAMLAFSGFIHHTIITGKGMLG